MAQLFQELRAPAQSAELAVLHPAATLLLLLALNEGLPPPPPHTEMNENLSPRDYKNVVRKCNQYLLPTVKSQHLGHVDGGYMGIFRTIFLKFLFI